MLHNLNPWTKDVNQTYKRRLEDFKDVFWTSYARSIYVLCPEGKVYEVYGVYENHEQLINIDWSIYSEYTT